MADSKFVTNRIRYRHSSWVPLDSLLRKYSLDNNYFSGRECPKDVR